MGHKYHITAKKDKKNWIVIVKAENKTSIIFSTCKTAEQ